MKHSRFFHTLALAAILALLMIAIVATPALAAESVSVSPAKGEVGSRVDVSGSGYTSAATVYIYFSSQDADVGDDIDDLDAYERVKTTTAQLSTDPYPGTIDTYFNVPSRLEDGDEVEDVHGGDYFIYTTYTTGGNIEAVDEFIIIGIEQIDPNEGPVGTEVEITGSGFDRNEDITIAYDNIDVDIESGDDQTDTRGEFTCTILIPASTVGAHTITAEDESRNEGGATFTVTPEITISPTSGIVSDEVTVSGTGFGRSKGVTIYFDGDEVDITGDDETDTKGSFEASFEVPSVGPGTYDVKAEDASDNEATAEFTIATSISISPTTSGASPGY
ncbi:MAG: IPT/TIG domain-containing protein, partial [Dehalococcoidia bacterium]|nr:IPT/TIG domain-containing protein [Dehalococcoidia bacterium]